MGRKMSNAPVYFVLAQVRFNQLAALDNYVPAIQDSLRKAGYPDFQSFQMAHLLIGGAVPKPAMTTRYLFLNSKKTNGLVLDQSWLMFQTTNYDTVDPFVAAFLDGLSLLHGAAGLNYSDRVGIRYLDAIVPRAGEAISDYLQPYVLGLSDLLPDRTLAHSISETKTTLGKTTLLGRAIIHNQKEGNAAFPEDLMPVHLTLADKFSDIRGLYAILDTDSWTEERKDFDLGSLENTLKSLHTSMRRSFDLMVTPHALHVWN
jgi:uncharacterized protein (TIGR04255 family)